MEKSSGKDAKITITNDKGRLSKEVIEQARDKIANAVNADAANIVFTSGASEGAALLLRGNRIKCSKIEHPCVCSWCDTSLELSETGLVVVDDKSNSTVQLANSETGIIQDVSGGLFMSDIVQGLGKVDFSFTESDLQSALISAHKIGGPKGVGAVITNSEIELEAQILGGGQEKGQRSGTENVIAIAGFGAAMELAKKRLDDGEWQRVQELRDYLEAELLNIAPNTTFIGKGLRRTPNTSYFSTRGWTGENQVIQMDLSGFAISAGSACSSGKVSKSKVVREMGYGSHVADCAIRISLSPENTKDEIESFVKKWSEAYSNNKIAFA